MHKVFIVGMGLSARDLTEQHLEIVRSADILVGGQRHLDQFNDLPMPKERITGNVEKTVRFIQNHCADSRIVVLASGDPLFFGIGTRIVKALGSEAVTVLPNITSIAAAFARINTSWSEAVIISLHGRSRRYQLLEAIKSRRPVAVLTDARQSPQWLARWLMEKGVDNTEMAVFEQLGSGDETFDWYPLNQAADATFSSPNVVILKPMSNHGATDDLVLGMGDDDYRHDGGMITKSEVRAVTLAKLRLKPGLTLWDLGAGSGSVGIEASVLLGHGRIVAVEQDAGRVARIRQNALQYGVCNIDVKQAVLPEGLADLPPPDRIFIGGGGRHLPSIVRTAAQFLAPGGIMVANTVLVDNLTRVLETMDAAGMQTEMVQMQISRSKAMPWSRRMEAHNPVWIVSGAKDR
ncbi:MAG: precorrin-6y C5,15-methyltransferase (decarboxylating) subunit CbiE [Desulfobacteraceae bacterium]|jgi:precorrin-6Y C5,15-methyltransferase (decarboxylating)